MIDNKGYTFIELIIYISIVSVSVLVFTGFIVNITKASARTEANLNTQYNAKFVMNKITNQVRKASSYYVAPDSIFNNDQGKITLKMLNDEGNYDDLSFYLQNDMVFMKKNAGAGEIISDDDINFTKLRFDNDGAILSINLTAQNKLNSDKIIELYSSSSVRNLIY
ncbi:MAG: hypothetical protein Q8P20_00010 [bacterium]|nr:hypothetical protein [bacterium]